jgi:hypothetical protein
MNQANRLQRGRDDDSLQAAECRARFQRGNPLPSQLNQDCRPDLVP